MYIAATAPGLGAIARPAPRVRVMPSPGPLRKIYVRRGMGGCGCAGRRGVGDILQPTTGTVQSSMINWSGPPVTVPDASQQLSQLVSSLENDVRYKLESGGTILDPAACPAKLQGEIASQCSMYPGVCQGVDIGSLIQNFCGNYSSYLAQQQASLGNPQTNYVAPSIAYPIYNEGQQVQYYQPAPTSQPTFFNNPNQAPGVVPSSSSSSSSSSSHASSSAPAPPPVVSSNSSAAPSTVGTLQVTGGPGPLGPAITQAAAAAGGGSSLPDWALPVGIAAVVALFMFGGSR